LDNLEIPWLEPLADAWRGAALRGRPAHAVLLTGSPGVGKRAAAAWLATERLGLTPSARLPLYRGEATDSSEPPHTTFQQLQDHADLRWLRPLEGKQSIHIDQVRELVDDLNLTSYEGGAKVAIIEPANAMTANAANSLLKTLEEPPGDTLLILVADRVGSLPPTILSRCQRLNVATPPEAMSLEWLHRVAPASDWVSALRLAGGAPLAAIRVRERLEVMEAMARDFARIAERSLSPIDVAGRWCQLEQDFVLEWIARQVQQCIYRLSGSAGDRYETSVAESVLRRIDRRNLFCYLDDLNRVRCQPAGSYNVQLTLESLLIDWAEGLRNCSNKFIRGGLLPVPEGKVNA
jgi:DNA polymerase-3 subunit delta'